jgi:IPT/TIG domain
MRLRPRSLSAAGVLVVALVAIPAVHATGATAPPHLVPAAASWHAPGAVPDTTASATPSVDLPVISCGAPGNCSAAGELASGSLYVANEVDSTWHGAQLIPGVVSLDDATTATVTSITCVAAGSCVLGGSLGAAGSQQAFLANEVDGTWRTARVVPGSAKLNTNGNAAVETIACTSPGECSAGGYLGTGGKGDFCQFAGCLSAFVVDEVGGVWGDVTVLANPVVGGSGQNDGQLSYVACPSSGSCTGVGNVGTQGYLFGVDQAHGTWATSTEISLSALPGYVAGNLVEFRGLTCWPGSCVAYGSYMDGEPQPGKFSIVPFQVDEVAGAWQAAETMPAEDISCQSTTSCSGIEPSGSVVDEVGGTWQAPQTLEGLPAGSNVVANAITCTSTGNCVAGGAYGSGYQYDNAFVVDEVAGVWQSASTVAGTSLAPYDVLRNVDAIACSSASTCTAIGIATRAAANPLEEAMVLDFGPASPTVRRVAPASGAARGGAVVRIYGSNLGPAAVVVFGSRHATDVVRVSPGELQVTSPPGSGIVAVKVITPWGTSSAVSYTYHATK